MVANGKAWCSRGRKPFAANGRPKRACRWSWWFLGGFCLVIWRPPAWAWQPAARATAGFSVTDYGPHLGAAFDFELEGVLRPLPEVELGIEAALSLPLPTGKETTPSNVLFRANPLLGLRFGDDQRWIYARAGFGLDSHVRSGELEPVAVVCGALGLVVAPSELWAAFGFEVSGKMEVAGQLPTRALGLGGFVEFEF